MKAWFAMFYFSFTALGQLSGKTHSLLCFLVILPSPISFSLFFETDALDVCNWKKFEMGIGLPHLSVYIFLKIKALWWNLSPIKIIDAFFRPEPPENLKIRSTFRCQLINPFIAATMNVFKRTFRFYRDGFSNLPRWGKQVWLVILIKLFIMFVILKIFFFPNFLKTNFDNDADRSNHVLENLTNITNN